MIFNFDVMEKKELEADIVIIGAGAAGITLALEFIDQNIKVALFESGDLKIRKRNQKLNLVQNTGIPYYDLSAQRGRYFGGTTNFWGGTCIPLEHTDFEENAARPGFKWPISFSEISPYINKAKVICGVDAINSNKLIQKLHLKKNNLKSAMFEWRALQFSPFPFRFGERYRSKLNEAKNIDVYLNANLVSFESNRSKTVCKKATFRSVNGKEVKVSAKYFILSTGGVENPRLLLNMKALFANRNIGKYFAEHPTAIIGKLVGRDASKIYAEHQKKYIFDKEIKPGFSATEQFMKNHNLLNSFLTIWPIPKDMYVISRAKMLLYLLRRREFGIKLLLNLLFVIPKSATLLPHVFNRMGGRKNEINQLDDCFDVRLVTETIPNFFSDISLSEERDALGMFRASLNWQLEDIDRRTFIFTAKAFKEQIEKTYDVKLELESWIHNDEENWYTNINLDGHHGHHMGTTRMASNSKNGVVDKNCKVFGIQNVYVSGSSIFPTYGFSNPTLTIVAFALRLSDHLKNKLKIGL